MHLLIFLKGPHKNHDAAHVNTLISAQIPDPDLYPHLYSCVTKYKKEMLHGPCGALDHVRALCMQKDAHQNWCCTKHYPRDFCDHTHFSEEGYPVYARPNNDYSFSKQPGVMSTPTGMLSPIISTSLQSTAATSIRRSVPMS